MLGIRTGGSLNHRVSLDLYMDLAPGKGRCRWVLIRAVSWSALCFRKIILSVIRRTEEG